MTERIYYTTILEVTYDERTIHLIMSIKYKVIVEDPGSPNQNTPHSMSLVLCETLSYITNKRKRRPQTTICKNKIQRQVYQCILYRNLVVLIPRQNRFKTFPHISGL